MNHVSPSCLTTFAVCPRRYYFQYRLGRIPARDPAAFRVGTFVHEALSRWWSDGPEACRRWAVDHSGDIDLIDAMRASAMLEHYDPPADHYEVVGVETPFEVKLRLPGGNRPIRGLRVVGQVDALLRETTSGRLIVRECKTTSESIIGFGPYWARVAIDLQISIYRMAFEADGVIYDVLRKPPFKPSRVDRDAAGSSDELAVAKAFRDRVSSVIRSAPEEWYQWREVVVTPEELAALRTSICDSVLNLLEAEKRDRFPMHTHSCRTISGVCPYLDVCTGRASLDDADLFTDKGRR